MQPSSPEAFKLMMQGSEALTDVEVNGMRIDVAYLDRMIVESELKIKEMERELRVDPVFSEWRKRFGEKADLGSRDQLGWVVFSHLKYESKVRTKTGRVSTNKAAFEDIDHPFVKKWESTQALKTARQTYLLGIKSEVIGDRLRPVQNLHLASTYRSSVHDPNLQNQPVRDPKMAKLIRRAFITEGDDWDLLEVDYSALEFKGAANFWNDPDMIRYASDPTLDVHRDLAAECYLLSRSEVTKGARSDGKNGFVFPRLYGSYYGNISPDLWNRARKLTTKSGQNMMEHLAEKGITTTEQFVSHVEKVQNKFDGWFPHWSQQKDIWWDRYVKQGWFELLTGFVCHGVFSYNNLMNTPIQGPSFHLLLWSLIQLNAWLKKNHMRSKIICQIHDSIIFALYRKEKDDVIEMARQVMTRDVRNHWKWIKTPLGVEFEISSTNWFDKKPLAV